MSGEQTETGLRQNNGAERGDHLALIDAFVRSGFVVTDLMKTVGSAHGITLTQVRMLGLLRGRSLRMVELADYMGVDRSTVSGLVDRALGHGLVQRTRGAGDGRAVFVSLTEQGERVAERAHNEITRSISPIIGTLDDARRRHLTALLEDVLGPSLLAA